MADSSEKLQELLLQVGRAGGLRERIKIVESSLDLVRSLSPHDRERVAMRVGSQWAWKSIEKFLSRDGDFDDKDQLAKKAFERLSEADPKSVRKFVSDLRSGETSLLNNPLVDEVTKRGLEQLKETDGEELANVAKLAAAGNAEALENLAVDSLGEILDPSMPELGEEEKGREVEAIPTREENTAPPASIAEPTPRPTPPAPVVARPTATNFEDQTSLDWSLDWDSPGALAAPRREMPVALGRETGCDGTLPFTTTRERMGALRKLREGPNTARSLGRAGRRKLLAQLGGGWPARRALSEFLRAQAYDDLSEALGWIDGLETATRQTWCLADLLQHGSLSEEDRERVINAAPSSASRRRLRRRHESLEARR